MRSIKTKTQFFILLAAAFILSVAITIVYRSPGNESKEKHASDTYPLDIKISPRKNIFKKSEYVVIDITATNVSDFDVSYPTGVGCPFGDPAVYVNEAEKPINIGYIFCTLAASPPLSPGGSFKRTIELDLSYMESGIHSLVAEYVFDGPKGTERAVSEKINFALAPADNIYDCSQYTDYSSTICENVLIIAKNQSKELNNKTCALIKERLNSTAPEVNPIPYLSTAKCNDGEPAVFVFNTFKNSSISFDSLVSKLAQKDGAICSSTKYSMQRIESRLETTHC